MFHGSRDYQLDLSEHALALSRALEKAKKPHYFVEYEFEEQAMKRSPYRTDMLVRIADFLYEHIGAD